MHTARVGSDESTNSLIITGHGRRVDIAAGELGMFVKDLVGRLERAMPECGFKERSAVEVVPHIRKH